jgi:starch synthase
MKILMVASEATPFCKTGGLADVIGALPAALLEKGEQVAVVLPGYRENKYPAPLRGVYPKVSIPLAGDYTVDISETVERGVTFYIVSCPPLFDRDGLYGTRGKDYPDNAVRFAVFCRAAHSVVRHLFRADIIHCHDWQSALLPVYIRRIFRGDPIVIGARILFTIHNLGYQGLFDASVLPDIGLDPGVYTPELMEFFGKLNFLKGAIHYSDAVSTVSPTYAREIQTPELGFGLDIYLRTHAKVLTGILNGVDYSEWSPEADQYIAARYSVEDLSGKKQCKQALLEQYGLPLENMDRPLIGIVSRLVNQKGFDLIAEIAPQLRDLDLCMTVLGSGEPQYQDLFLELAASQPERFGVSIGYDNALAHRIEAGADMFLMPSHYEPSGLNQIYSLRYGTIPIVRATGGLDDSIDEETGFKFHEYSGPALLQAIESALAAFANQEGWRAMMRRAMLRDFSWGKAAEGYVALYRQLLAG